MPLSDFIQTLNASSHLFEAGGDHHRFDHPFVSSSGRVFLHYANIRLESQFLPIINVRSGSHHGHTASFQAFGLSNSIQLLPEAVFVLPTDDQEFIYLDRLVRTLHALNYLTRPAKGNLLLKVHSRHLTSVPSNHGLAFEEILRPCGLIPEQITLEIDTEFVSDPDHLIRAVQSYRSRGYGIAIGHFGRQRTNLSLLKALEPDIVKLDTVFVERNPELADVLGRIKLLTKQILIDRKAVQFMTDADTLSHIDLIQQSTPAKRLLNSTHEKSGVRIATQHAA